MITWVSCPLCGHRIRKPFLPTVGPLVEIHRYRGERTVCRLLLMPDPRGPRVTVIPAGELEEDALARGWRELRRSA